MAAEFTRYFMSGFIILVIDFIIFSTRNLTSFDLAMSCYYLPVY